MVMPAQDSGIKPAVRHFDVFRNTVRKWLRRYQRSRIAGLPGLSRVPHHIPPKTAAKTKAKVIRLKWRLRKSGSIVNVLREPHQTEDVRHAPDKRDSGERLGDDDHVQV